MFCSSVCFKAYEHLSLSTALSNPYRTMLLSTKIYYMHLAEKESFCISCGVRYAKVKAEVKTIEDLEDNVPGRDSIQKTNKEC